MTKNSLFLIGCLLILFGINAYSFQHKAVRLGVDALIESDFKLIKNKRIILLSNFTGRDGNGDLTAQILSKTNKTKLIAIFAPEHGFYSTAAAGKKIADDHLFGVPVYSLYGANRKPTKKQLSRAEAIVVDIQDAGIRSYTYISTLFKVMEAAAEQKIPVIVLDRPNPLGGYVVDGNVLEKGKESFVGIAPIAYIHGCTIGELAEMFNGENWLKDSRGRTIKCNITVVKMKDYNRAMQWEDTGLIWFPTSPNIPTVNSIRGMAMIGLFGELGIVSVGIGTTLPFQYIGIPKADFKKVEKDLDADKTPGIYFNYCKYKPNFGLFSNSECEGLLISFKRDNDIEPFTNGIKLMLAIRKYNPSCFDFTNTKESGKSMFIKASGTDEIYNAFLKKASDEYILKLAQKGLDAYLDLRKKYLIYD